MAMSAERLVDLLYPGVTHIVCSTEGGLDIDYTLRATHGRVVLDLVSPQCPDGVSTDIVSAREIDEGDWEMKFKPRVEAAVRRAVLEGERRS